MQSQLYSSILGAVIYWILVDIFHSMIDVIVV